MKPKMVLTDAEAEGFLNYLHGKRKEKKSFAEVLEEAVRFWIEKQRKEVLK